MIKSSSGFNTLYLCMDIHDVPAIWLLHS